MAGIDDLLHIMRRLRDPERGCAWDLRQDFRSIAPYTLEEAYEVLDAIERMDMPALRDELGDLLLQVVYHAQMAEEAGDFAFNDVENSIVNKMIRRHPHVSFEDLPGLGEASPSRDGSISGQILSPEDAAGIDPAAPPDWEQLKRAERTAAGTTSQPLSQQVPPGFPALVRAEKLARHAARDGFDWPDWRQVRDKLDEELDELDAALAANERSEIEAELGDVLFTLANLARRLDIDAEAALRGANAKFCRRYEYVQQAARATGHEAAEVELPVLEEYWQQAKRQGL